MAKPEFITNEDIKRWSKNIENDTSLPQNYKDSPIIHEVCLAGLWLAEELEKLSCPILTIQRIQWTAGNLSFGRDIWDTHRDILEKYKTNDIYFEKDQNEIEN